MECCNLKAINMYFMWFIPLGYRINAQRLEYWWEIKLNYSREIAAVENKVGNVVKHLMVMLKFKIH